MLSADCSSNLSLQQGKITHFTKPPGTVGMQNGSIILGRKILPGSPPNNGAPPAPIPPPVPPLPRTLDEPPSPYYNTTVSPVFNTTAADQGLLSEGEGGARKLLHNFMHMLHW